MPRMYGILHLILRGSSYNINYVDFSHSVAFTRRGAMRKGCIYSFFSLRGGAVYCHYLYLHQQIHLFQLLPVHVIRLFQIDPCRLNAAMSHHIRQFDNIMI